MENPFHYRGLSGGNAVGAAGTTMRGLNVAIIGDKMTRQHGITGNLFEIHTVPIHTLVRRAVVAKQRGFVPPTGGLTGGAMIAVI